jgi:hypothetical protein
MMALPSTTCSLVHFSLLQRGRRSLENSSTPHQKEEENTATITHLSEYI